MNGFVSTAANTLRTISASLATRVWSHSWFGFTEFRWSINLSCEETAAVTYLVYTHLVRAATFKVMPSGPLSSLASALYVCSRSITGETLLWYLSALHPTNAPFIRAVCTSGEVPGNFFISDKYRGSVQLLSDREASLPIHTDVPSSYSPADGRQISEVCQTSPERSTRIPLLGDPPGISRILTSGPEEPQAVGGMFGLTSAVLLHKLCSQAVFSRQLQWFPATA